MRTKAYAQLRGKRGEKLRHIQYEQKTKIKYLDTTSTRTGAGSGYDDE